MQTLEENEKLRTQLEDSNGAVQQKEEEVRRMWEEVQRLNSTIQTSITMAPSNGGAASAIQSGIPVIGTAGTAGQPGTTYIYVPCTTGTDASGHPITIANGHISAVAPTGSASAEQASAAQVGVAGSSTPTSTIAAGMSFQTINPGYFTIGKLD